MSDNDGNSNKADLLVKAKEFAGEFLAEKGFKIIKKDFIFGNVGSIDLIARNDITLVFVILLTRFNPKFSDPISGLTNTFRKKLRKTAEAYMVFNGITNQECRFDVLILDYAFNENKPDVNYIENAF